MVDLWVEIATLSVLIGLSGFFSGLRSSSCWSKEIQSCSIV